MKDKNTTEMEKVIHIDMHKLTKEIDQFMLKFNPKKTEKEN